MLRDIEIRNWWQLKSKLTKIKISFSFSQAYPNIGLHSEYADWRRQWHQQEHQKKRKKQKQKAKEIKLTNIFDAVDEKVKTVQCKKESKKGCNGKSTKCLTHNLWDELENHINDFFKEKSLEDLVKDNHERRV